MVRANARDVTPDNFQALRHGSTESEHALTVVGQLSVHHEREAAVPTQLVLPQMSGGDAVELPVRLPAENRMRKVHAVELGPAHDVLDFTGVSLRPEQTIQ